MRPETRELIDRLGLLPHPEGGYFRETFRSPHVVTGLGGQPRAASTAIYFLLPASTFSALHRVRADETWHHYGGDPLDLHLIDDAGAHSVIRLGTNLLAGESPQAVVPAGVFQAAVPVGELHALVGCTVAPGFDFVDFEMPSRAELCARFPGLRELIARLTREG